MPTRAFRPFEPDHLLLLPPSLRDWLPADHLAYFVADVVEQWICSRFGTPMAISRGARSRMIPGCWWPFCSMPALWASRQITRRLHEDIAFRVLAANTTPDFRTISDFRTQHLAALRGLFVQVLRLCQHAGLVTLGRIALDGHKTQGQCFDAHRDELRVGAE